MLQMMHQDRIRAAVNPIIGKKAPFSSTRSCILSELNEAILRAKHISFNSLWVAGPMQSVVLQTSGNPLVACSNAVL